VAKIIVDLQDKFPPFIEMQYEQEEKNNTLPFSRLPKEEESDFLSQFYKQKKDSESKDNS
jgi:hypothetical protein